VKTCLSNCREFSTSIREARPNSPPSSCDGHRFDSTVCSEIEAAPRYRAAIYSPEILKTYA
jgi:hypothetical protein